MCGKYVPGGRSLQSYGVVGNYRGTKTDNVGGNSDIGKKAEGLTSYTLGLAKLHGNVPLASATEPSPDA